MGWGDAVQRETDWLTDITTVGLPVLLASEGGAWDLVLPYGRANGTVSPARVLFISRVSGTDARFTIGAQRIQAHQFLVSAEWPVRASSNPQADLAAFDAAIETVLIRIRGLVGDKTHGSRFLSVAEGHEATGGQTSAPARIDIDIDAPALAIANSKVTARISHVAVDLPFIA